MASAAELAASDERLKSRQRIAVTLPRDRSLLLLLFAAALLTLTLVQPKLTLEQPSYRYIFFFDITQSMNVADVGDPKVKRLDYAKHLLAIALGELPCGSSAGFALFSGHRVFLLFTPVDICTSYGDLLKVLDAIDWRMAWTASSEVAKGVHQSIQLMRFLDPRIRLVFISDGHEAPPLHPVYHPKFQGDPGLIKGLIVGVGGLTPVPIPKLDADGKTVGYWKPNEVMQVDTYSLGRLGSSVKNETMVGVDSSNLAQRIRQGTEHLSALQESHLQQIAGETGLAYYRLRDSTELRQQLTSPAMAEFKPQATDIRWVLAALALLLMVLAFIRRQALGP